MNTTDQLRLEKRLSQLHEFQQQSEKLCSEYDQGAETGYVTDSSLNSRKNSQSKEEKQKQQEPSGDEKLVVPNRRKTKSERDKRRSSRISLLESKSESGSENSTDTNTEEKQSRYRKRSSGKRADNHNSINNGSEVMVTLNHNINSKENHRRSRTSSKLVAQQQEQQQQQQEQQNEKSQHQQQQQLRDETNKENENKDSSQCVTTLKMNSKDIYFGTWDPKERAVLDQVLHNIDSKPFNGNSHTNKKQFSFIDKFKRSKNTDKNNQHITRQYENIIEEHSINKAKKYQNNSLNYPFNKYINDGDKYSKKRSGLLKKFKEALLKGSQHNGEKTVLDDDEEYHLRYGVSATHQDHHKRSKSFFGRLSRKKNSEFDVPRRRAHSSNDYARCVGVYLQPEQQYNSNTNNTNLNKARSVSTHSLKNLFSKTKSVDDLHGAFEFYSNQKHQVFQRTPSMVKLDSKHTSSENLGSSKKSLNNCHGFEPAKPSVKELCYEDNHLVYARTKHTQPLQANQCHILPRQHPTSDGYYSAYEDDYFRDYHFVDRSPLFTNNIPQNYHHFNFDISFSDCESFSRGNSLKPPQPGYFTPNLNRRDFRHHHHHHPQSPQFPSYRQPHYYHHHHQAPPMPGFYTPGYATPAHLTPCRSGRQSGYTSENEYHYYPPSNHRTCHQTSLPQTARRMFQRSVSKTSSNYSSAYEYMSESSFYDEEDLYNMVHPPQNLEQNNSKYPQTISNGRKSQEPPRQQPLCSDV